MSNEVTIRFDLEAGDAGIAIALGKCLEMAGKHGTIDVNAEYWQTTYTVTTPDRAEGMAVERAKRLAAQAEREEQYRLEREAKKRAEEEAAAE